MFILCCVTLLNSLFSSRSLYVDSLGYCVSTPLCYLKIRILLFLPSWSECFLFLSSPLYRGSTILNKSSEIRYFALVLAFSLSPLNMMLAVGFCSYSLLSLRSTSLFLFSWEFLSWIFVEFCQMLFLHQLIWTCDCPSLACYYGKLYWLIFEFWISLHPWNTPPLAIFLYISELHLLLFVKDLLLYLWETSDWGFFLFFFFGTGFIWFWNPGKTSFPKWIEKWSLCVHFLEAIA